VRQKVVGIEVWLDGEREGEREREREEKVEE